MTGHGEDTSSHPSYGFPAGGREGPLTRTLAAGAAPTVSGGCGVPPGTVLAGRYRVVELTGRGGMGELYRAEDLKLGCRVALKLLPEPLRGDDAARRRFLDEARLARRVTHPNVCRVYDVGEVDGAPFISMEHVDGEDLASLLRRIGRLPVERAIRVAHQLCDALEAVHREGILHRDLKPSNLMIDGQGRARIADFGIALPASTPGVRKGGTPGYRAPELCEKPPSVASDLYSLGLVLHEMFFGERAAPDGSIADALLALLPLGLDRVVEQAITRCLAPDPEHRPASAAAVAAALPGGDEEPAWKPVAFHALPGRPHWTLRRKLGAGGFGEAWLATHCKTGERRVFKFCFKAGDVPLLQREVTLFRFLKEELGPRDDICCILDWQLEESPYFIESEYSPEGSLPDWMKRCGGGRGVSLDLRLEVVAQVAEALAAAHEAGVLHKDVQPANILITSAPDGRIQAKLSGFGIGHVVNERRLAEAKITLLGLNEVLPAATPGTSLYMAPELLVGHEAAPESDVYALGVVLYQLVIDDFTRLPAPGWERRVGDELLLRDIAAMVEGEPDLRLSDPGEVAVRLRTLGKRRQHHARRQWGRRNLPTLAAILASLVLGLLAVLKWDPTQEKRYEPRDGQGMVLRWEDALADRYSEGRAEGELQATRRAIVLLARHRYRELPDGFEQRLEAIDALERLCEVLEQVSDGISLEELNLGDPAP